MSLLSSNDAQINVLHICNNVTSTLSFVALLFFFTYIFRYSPEKITFPIKLLCNLFFADFVYTISNLISNLSGDSDTVCKIEGFLRTFSLWASVLWATMIAAVAYARTVKNAITIEHKYPLLVLIGYVFPLLISTIPLWSTSISYEYNQVYCWVVGKDDQQTALIGVLIFGVWMWIATMITTYLYIRIILFLKNLGFSNSIIQMKKLLVFPVILYITFIPVTIDDLNLLPKYKYIFTVLHVILGHSLGLFNLVAYGYQRIRGGLTARGGSKHNLPSESGDGHLHDSDLNDLSLRSESEKPNKKSREYSETENSLREVLVQAIH